MQLHVVKLGRVAYRELEGLGAMYQERIRSWCRIECSHAKTYKGKKATGELWITLEEKGTSLGSEEFAKRLSRWRDDPQWKRIVFFIGDPYGLPNDVVAERDFAWCLSPLTLTSDLAWIVCLEQIYRATQILAGSDYHHR